MNAKVHDRADIFSLGVIMNQMISKEIPWKGMQPFQVIYAVSMKHERPEIIESCPPQFKALIERCWDREVHNRPRAKELVRLLDALHEEECIMQQTSALGLKPDAAISSAARVTETRSEAELLKFVNESSAEALQNFVNADK